MRTPASGDLSTPTRSDPSTALDYYGDGVYGESYGSPSAQSEQKEMERLVATGLVCEHGVHAAAWCDICDQQPDGTVGV